MKLRRNKKGFTIIELVIVIAVIGILAAILIPTFVNLTNKANEAADNALVNNLNKALKMEEQEPGHQKAPTLEGAIKDLEKQGYLLENLASKSGKDLLWSQSENQFLLNTENKSGKDYWKIVDAVPEKADQKYSYYAGKNFNQTNVTVAYGFDAGRNDGIAKVTYEGNVNHTAQGVAIRTNGGNLSVNAEFDTLHHYGFTDKVEIEKVNGASYHEYGSTGTLSIKQGHIEVEQGGYIAQAEILNSSSLTTAAKESVGVVVASENATIEGTKPDITHRLISYTLVDSEKNTYSYQDNGSTKIALFVRTADELKNVVNGTTSLAGIDKVALENDINVASTEGILYNVTTEVNLDLNGKTLSTTLSVGGQNDYLFKITNGGTLNLYDSFGKGKLSVELEEGNYKYKGEYVVCVDNGSFNMYAGEIIADWSKGTDPLGFGVDVYCNGEYDSYFNMYAGSIVTPKDEAIGCRSNNNTGTAYVTINNGYVSGWDAIFTQEQSAAATNHNTIVVNGGQLIGTKAAIRIYNSAVASKANQKLINITLNGGRFISTGNYERDYNDTIMMVHPSEVGYTGWEIVTVNDNR